MHEAKSPVRRLIALDRHQMRLESPWDPITLLLMDVESGPSERTTYRVETRELPGAAR